MVFSFRNYKAPDPLTGVMKMLKPLVIAAELALVTIPAHATTVSHHADCLVIVDSKSIVDGPYDMEVGNGGGLLVGPVLIFKNTDGTAAGSLNTDGDLGTLQQAGACWQNDRAKVCAWKPGEHRSVNKIELGSPRTPAEQARDAAKAAANGDPNDTPVPTEIMHRAMEGWGETFAKNAIAHNDGPINFDQLLATTQLDPGVYNFLRDHRDQAHKWAMEGVAKVTKNAAAR
jgi:hypothetical protein